MDDPIFVDLDGTLIRTDVFGESILKFLARSPLSIFQLLRWLIAGRSVAKTMLARKVEIDPELLPYNDAVLQFLRDKKAAGHQIILATASHHRHAARIARYLKLFDDSMGSNARVNLKGKRKADKILSYTQGTGFTYVGDSMADIRIWQHASDCVVVNARKGVIDRLTRLGKTPTILSEKAGQFAAFCKQMRIHQWSKNTLVFVPLITAHEYLHVSAIASSLLAFACFSLCASGGYFVNDSLDLDSDRRHDTKRNRPLASGRLDLLFGAAGAVLLPLSAFTLAAVTLPPQFLIVLVAYFVLSITYSFFLKRKATVDVIALALLYTLRVVGGAFAISTLLSSWLTAFMVFFFVNLAYLKRYIEVGLRTSAEEYEVPGRGYDRGDSETTFTLGVSSANASILVLALYINSPEVIGIYNSPQFLWGLCLVLMYWINRIWTRARRDEIDDDPVVFAMRDRISYYAAILMAASLLAAKFL